MRTCLRSASLARCTRTAAFPGVVRECSAKSFRLPSLMSTMRSASPYSGFNVSTKAETHWQISCVISASGASCVLNLAFGWPKDRIGLWLYDGVGELDVTAVIDVYQATNAIYTVGGKPSVVSRHGLQFLPRWNVQTLAKRLEVRSTLNLAGQKWPLRPLLVLLLAGLTGLVALSGVAWLVRRVRAMPQR
jgi:hypothetical protein